MIKISPSVQIDENELQFEYVRSSGPGGQNVNKVATAVQLRFDVRRTTALDEETKSRLIQLAGSRMTADGVLVIDARRYRTQDQNRADALQRLTAIVRQSLDKPKTRKATRPSVTAKAARLGAKKRRGEIKRFRRYIPDDWE